MHTIIFNTFSKRWVQFRVGAIPCLPLVKSIDFNLSSGFKLLENAHIFIHFPTLCKYNNLNYGLLKIDKKL